MYTHTRNYKQNVARRAYTNSFDAIDSPTKVESVEFDSYVGVKVAGERPPKTKVRTLNLGGAFKAFENFLVNKILLSPIRENIKCPKALPSRLVHAYSFAEAVGFATTWVVSPNPKS